MQAAIAEGLYEVHAGLVDVGLSRLSRALEKARSLKSALTDALIALVKANEVAHRPDQATVYLRELTQHLKTSKQDRAKFHQRLHIEAIEQKRGALEGLWEQSQRAHDRADTATTFSTRQALTLARVEMLERLAVTAELRDDVTGEHLYRVGRLASLLAAAAGCDAQTCFMVDIAARLHDIGKIGIPDGILQKPGKFTKAERELMKTHTTIGAETLADSDIPHMQMAEDIARCHHEWWDGSGYPMGLVGEAIPLHARITALADVFDALTHPRSYKGPWTTRDALDLIRKDRGTHFDPELTDLLLELIPQLQREYGDLDEYLGRAARESKFLRARNSIAKVLRQSRDDEADPERFETQR
jgi:putative two-component system response regulator